MRFAILRISIAISTVYLRFILLVANIITGNLLWKFINLLKILITS